MRSEKFRRSRSLDDGILRSNKLSDHQKPQKDDGYSSEVAKLSWDPQALSKINWCFQKWDGKEQGVDSLEDDQGKKIIEGLKEHSSFLNEGEIKSIKDMLESAKQGLKKFQQSYENGSSEWKEVLTSGDEGNAIQAVYLGLKCLTSTTTSKEKRDQFISLFQKFAGEGLSIIVSMDERYDKRLPGICNESSVKKLLTDPKYADLFDDYTPESSVWQYLSDLDKSFDEARINRTTWSWSEQELAKFQKKQGVLYGFPPDAITEFVKHHSPLDAFYSFQSLSENEKLLRKSSHDKKFRETDNNQSKIRELLNQKFSAIPEDAREYIVSRSMEKLFGAVYSADIRSKGDKYYCAKLNFIFNHSGMPEYLASLNPPAS